MEGACLHDASEGGRARPIGTCWGDTGFPANLLTLQLKHFLLVPFFFLSLCAMGEVGLLLLMALLITYGPLVENLNALFQSSSQSNTW